MPELSEHADSHEMMPLPYHAAIRDHLKAEEPDVWRWYASNKVQKERADAVRLELLKSTYRVERDLQPETYAMADDAASRLGLAVPVTIYQAQNSQGLNASLAYVPDEAHIVLHGPLSSKLTGPEFRALLAHELSHFLFWQAWNGEYLIVDQILSALTHDAMAHASHFASARLFGLYNEVFCDRGALRVAEDPLIVISMLLKVETQLDEVSPESYMRQAEEVFSRTDAKSEGWSHPEAYIRTRAVRLWADRDPDADRKISAMIEGPMALNQLDLLAQRNVARLTRRLLDVLLSPPWFQSDVVLAHARLFFDDYAPPDHLQDDSALADDIGDGDSTMQDYYGYVLLDFVTADRDLEEMPLAAALSLAEKLGMKDRFVEIAKRELRLRKKQLEAIDQDKEKLLAEANARPSSR